jgi:hypothetical protein
VRIRLSVFHPLRFSLTTSVITYTYDRLYRLTGADYRSTGLTAGSIGETFEYGYDAVGNRAVQTRTPLKVICFCKLIVLGYARYEVNQFGLNYAV